MSGFVQALDAKVDLYLAYCALLLFNSDAAMGVVPTAKVELEEVCMHCSFDGSWSIMRGARSLSGVSTTARILVELQFWRISGALYIAIAL